MVVQHNIWAMNADRQLGITTKAQAESTQKLSSGYRVNRAADDAAGLSISEKMRRQIRGLGRASDNAMEGITLIQTADGALEEVHDMLHRMNELAVQAANGTNSASDRQHIQNEVDQLKSEIDRVATTAKYNEIYLLDGHLADPLKAGKVAREYAAHMEAADREIFVSDLNDKNAGLLSLADIKARGGMNIIYEEVAHDVATTQQPTGNATLSDPKYNALKNMLKTEIVPQAVVGIADTFRDTFGYLTGSTIGIGLSLENDPNSSVLASVTMGASAAISGGTVLSVQLKYNLNVNMATIVDANGNFDVSKREELEHTIVHEMMHALMDETLTAGMLGVDTSFQKNPTQYPFPDWFVEGMAQTAAGGCYDGNDWVNGSLGIDATTPLATIGTILTDPGNKIGTGTTPSQYGTGYLACMYLGYLVNGSISVQETDIIAGLDKLLAEVKSGTALDSAISKLTSYGGIKDLETKFGVDTASQQFVHDLVTAVGSGAGGLINKDYSVTDVLPNTSLSIGLFELNTGSEFVNNVYPNGYDVITGGHAYGSGGTGAPTGPGSGWGPGGPGKPNNPGSGGGTTPDTNKPIAATAIEHYAGGLKLQIGADSQNRMSIYIEGMGTSQIGVHNVDVTTQDNATRSIDMIAFGIQQVSTQRSALGAYQNRLEHTIKNLDNVVENTQASESKIRDTDMATEMVRFTNNNILMQAGQAMLAQANQSRQSVLQLVS